MNVHPDEALAAVDAARRSMFDAYRARDLDAFMDGYTRDVRYTTLEGRVDDWARLRRDTSAEWLVVRTPQAEWRRQSWSMQDGRLSEVIDHEISAVVHGWFVFKRTQTLRRRTAYDWRFVDGRWRMAELRVLEEDRRSSPFELGFHPAGLVMLALLVAVIYGIYRLLR
jgi:hypothetical protein